ncbi:MAG: DUF308 domain-containing protein [Hyphomicrobiales bacterium]|nr:DUF308 domain-containing protein [Hyphomicrobiales bacterium]
MAGARGAESFHGSGSGTDTLYAKWYLIMALGVVYILASAVALYSIVMSAVASVLIVGIMMLIAGVAEVINACQLKSWSKFFLWIAIGALYIFAGVATFENPVLASLLLTFMLGASLIISGMIRMTLGFSMKIGTPWVFVFLSGVITLLLGFVILAHWPVSSIYTLGFLLGLDLLFVGLSWIGVALRLRLGSRLSASMS